MIWLDAQLSPVLCGWIATEFKIPCIPLRDLDLITADDKLIFDKAKAQNVTIITKDSDFVDLVTRFGPPPKIILITCGKYLQRKVEICF